MVINSHISIPKIYSLLLIILLFLPKIDIISIPGYHQGIRLEDLILLLFAINYCINYKAGFIPANYQFKPIIIFITYLFFGNFVGHLSDLTIIPAVSIRYIEYIFLIFFINNLKISGLFLKKLCFTYLLVNLIVALLQENDLLGSLSSFGYLPTDHWFNARPFGILGGSWELGVAISLAFFIFLKYEKNRLNISVALVMSVIILLLTEGRGNIIAFFITTIFIFLSHQSLRRLLWLLVGLTIIIIINKFYFYDLFLNYSVNSSGETLLEDFKINIDLGKIIDLLKNFIINNEIPTREEIFKTNPNLLSFFFRLEYWSGMYNEFNTNIFTRLFGTGATEIYTDSMLIRLWFTSGYLGIILAIYLSKSMKIYQVIFFILSGLTLDIFMSFKIVLLALLINLKVRESDENSS